MCQALSELDMLVMTQKEDSAWMQIFQPPFVPDLSHESNNNTTWNLVC